MYIKITQLFKYWDKFENFVLFPNNKYLTDYFLRREFLEEINYFQDLKEYFIHEENIFFSQLEKNLVFLDKKISSKGFIEEGDIYYYLVIY